MLKVKAHKRFEKDTTLARKRGKKMEKLWGIVEQLQADIPLAIKHRPHRLSGDWFPCMECHIEPDWLLIYLVDEHTLHLIRTGTHADLFD
jgi:mRNA interferase YafQ